MSCHQVEILNYNHSIVELSKGNTLVVTDNNACHSVTIPQATTCILQVNSPGPQGPLPSPIGPDGAVQFKSGSSFSGEQGFRYDYTNDNVIISGSDNYLLQIHGKNDSPWAFGIYNDTYSSIQPVLAGFVWNNGRAAFGTEVNKPLEIYTDSGYYNPTLIISSSGVTIDNKLTVNNGITGSLFGSSSYALTASYAATYSFVNVQVQPYISSSDVYGPYGFNSILTASYAINGGGTIDTGSLATTGSNTFIGNQTISGSILSPINNNLNIQTSNSCGAIVFDRTLSSRLDINNNIAFDYNSWSVEAWVNFQDADTQIILGSLDQPSLNIYFDLNAIHERFYVQSESGLYNYWTNVTPSLDTWHHIAVGFDGTNVNAWLDGEQLSGGLQTPSIPYYGHKPLSIGAKNIDNNKSTMKLTNLRIVVGNTLYDPNSTSITVPTSQLTVVPNTKLLLLAKDSGSAYIDTSGNNSINSNFNTNWTSVTDLPQTIATNIFQFENDGTLNLPGNVIITGSLTMSPSSSFVLPLYNPIFPQTGSAYWSGSLLFVYDGTRYMSASFA